jgi:hypothetical protein
MSKFMPEDAARRVRHFIEGKTGRLGSKIQGGETWADFIPDDGIGVLAVRRGDVLFLDEESTNKGYVMDKTEALKLALAVLEPFKEAGQIYEDYKIDGDFDDEDYAAMCEAIKSLAKDEEPASMKFKTGDIVVCTHHTGNIDAGIVYGHAYVVECVVEKFRFGGSEGSGCTVRPYYGDSVLNDPDKKDKSLPYIHPERFFAKAWGSTVACLRTEDGQKFLFTSRPK